MRFKSFLPVGIIAFGVLVLLVSNLLAPAANKQPIEKVTPQVEVVELVPRSYVFDLASQGVVRPRTETKIVSQVAGVVTEVSEKFNAGGFFKQGEVILSIDPINYEVALLRAQAELDAAEAKVTEEKARSQQARKELKLLGKKLNDISKLALRLPQLKQAEADLKAAQANVENAKVLLKRTKIRAPYDALVKNKSVDIGQFVSIGSELATTFAVDFAEVRLPIKESDLRLLSYSSNNNLMPTATRVTLKPSGLENVDPIVTEIDRTEAVLDESSRVIFMVAKIHDPYGLTGKRTTGSAVPIGTFMKATLKSKRFDNLLAIPRKAVSMDEQMTLVDSNNKLTFADINPLYSDETFVYMKANQQEIKRLVLTPLHYPAEGMSVQSLISDKSIYASGNAINNGRTSSDQKTGEAL